MRINQIGDDPEHCREAVYSDDYYDIIIDYLGAYPLGNPVCMQRICEQYDIAYYSRQEIPELNLQDYPYSVIPKCFALTDQSAAEASGILRLQNSAGLDLKGQGVLVGFVDTGIDYTHSAFCREDGSTRILGIWDQTVADGTPPPGFLYGGFYDAAAINAALRADDPLQVVPSTDEDGHGTFLAGVACGSPDEAADFTGAAPLSSIAVVKCKQAKQYLREFYRIPDGAACYQENDLMAGMAWLNQFANELRMPLIICIGMGSGMGNHGGEDAVSAYADELGRRRQRAVIAAAGNEAAQRHHYFRTGIAEGEEENIEISVGEDVSGFLMEFWASVPDIYSIAVLSPTGERIPRTGDPFGGSESYSFLFEKTKLTVDYGIAGTRLGAQFISLRFENPAAGIWTVQVLPLQVISGEFNCWLPIREFLDGEVHFLHSDPDITILTPGMSQAAITAGAYQTAGGSVSADSGRGYSTTGTVKPDILAPGGGVYGPQQRGTYGRRTGTSASAAVTAGGCAQIFQWGIAENNMFYLNSTDLSNLLIRGAQRSPDRVYPNPVYGYGLLDVYSALDRLRRQ